jgi:hypothetical protein
MPAIRSHRRCRGPGSQRVKDVDLSKATLHTADQKLINIYPLPGVDQFPYTTLDSPKPLFPGNTSIGIKQIAPFFFIPHYLHGYYPLPCSRWQLRLTLNQLPSRGCSYSEQEYKPYIGASRLYSEPKYNPCSLGGQKTSLRPQPMCHFGYT